MWGIKLMDQYSVSYLPTGPDISITYISFIIITIFRQWV